MTRVIFSYPRNLTMIQYYLINIFKFPKLSQQSTLVWFPTFLPNPGSNLGPQWHLVLLSLQSPFRTFSGRGWIGVFHVSHIFEGSRQLFVGCLTTRIYLSFKGLRLNDFGYIYFPLPCGKSHMLSVCPISDAEFDQLAKMEFARLSPSGCFYISNMQRVIILDGSPMILASIGDLFLNQLPH